jgi:hypothetical protein
MGRRRIRPTFPALLLRNRIEQHLAGVAIDEIVAELCGTSAEGFKLTGKVELVIGVGAGVLVDEVAGQHPIYQQREFACSRSNRLRLADANGQAAVEGAERGPGASEAHCTTAQNGGRAIGRRRGPGAEQPTA